MTSKYIDVHYPCTWVSGVLLENDGIARNFYDFLEFPKKMGIIISQELYLIFGNEICIPDNLSCKMIFLYEFS